MPPPISKVDCQSSREEAAAGAAPCAYPPGSPPTGVAPVASATPSIKDWFVQDYGIYQEHTDDKRIGGRIALAEDHECESDAVALALGNELLSGRTCPKIEVWLDRKRVGVIESCSWLGA